MLESLRKRQEILKDIRSRAKPLDPGLNDVDSLLSRVGDASVVLLGESTHGTHDFYAIRAEITRRLIQEHGFNAIAIEADWPDALRIDRFVRGRPGDLRSIDALGDFERFPLWMWRNADMLDFVGWLRYHNMEHPSLDRVGLYGLDLYSRQSSIKAVVDYLERVDPEAAKQARRRYGCMELIDRDAHQYGMEAALGHGSSCEDDIVQQLVDLRRVTAEKALADPVDEDDAFHAERNAKLAVAAERYYREMYRGKVSTWNLRDEHMFETLRGLCQHLGKKQRPVKVIVWAHNSHVGDARATEMGDRGELNIGQLARQEFGTRARLIGFTTHHGTVSAASEWDGPLERKWVRPALPESYENLFHESGLGDFYLDMAGADPEIWDSRLGRAIGVIYLPATERNSHYFYSHLPKQFDAVIHLDATRAVEPLDQASLWDKAHTGETYPTGL